MLASQALSALALALIQTRMAAGKRPIGRLPPSLFGSEAITTSCHLVGHCPSFSQSFRSLASLWRIASGKAAMALGDVLSAPTPVLGEKVSAGKTMPSSEKARGGRGTIGAGPVLVSILDEVKVAQEIDVIRLRDSS